MKHTDRLQLSKNGTLLFQIGEILATLFNRVLSALLLYIFNTIIMKTPQIKKQIFRVNHGTYPFDVLICIGIKHKDVVNYLNKYTEVTEEESEALVMNGNGRAVMLEGGQTILQLNNDVNAIDFYATLAHEVFHVVEFLFQRIGIKHDYETSGEAFAYQIQYIIGSILEKIREKNNTKKRK